MKTRLLIISGLGFCAVAASLWLTRSLPPQTFAPAPPGPADPGPATKLTELPKDAIVFDLTYRVQTGSAEDLGYFSYWGFGSSTWEAKTNAFLQSVRQRTAHLSTVNNPLLKGRQWAAVEHQRGRALALYFDLDGNGVCSDNERILPAKRVNQKGVQFITPDFRQPREGGGEFLTRVLLQTDFYDGSTPNFMWSPACLLEGMAALDGKPARLLLFSSGFEGQFTRYGSAGYTLRTGQETNIPAGQYIARQTLSSVVECNGQFYHLKFDGQRPNGHVARAFLITNATPTGTLAVKLAGTNSILATLTSLYLQGIDDPNVFLSLGTSKKQLPAGTYTIVRGSITYGRDWEVSFTKGPQTAVAAHRTNEIEFGGPVLQVRAIHENDRYNPDKTAVSVFKQGASIYLEPSIVGRSQEIYGRFRHKRGPTTQMVDVPPQVTITGPDGKILLAKTMEYG